MPPARTPVRDADLTTYARIRNAALAGFARDGLEATSIRDVAAAAGVSPGLVQHHFTTKAGLRDAVNRHVIALAEEAFADLALGASPDEAIDVMGDRVAEFARDHATALLYVARALAEGDEGARRMFDAFVEITLASLRRLVDARALRPDADLEWAALHVVSFNLATRLFQDAIERHLPAPLFDAQQLERWNRATTDLYRRGLYRDRSGRAGSRGR